MRALLALEDETLLEGRSFGAQGRTMGELVFNTGMASYQDVLTDTTNYGQIVVMTYPLIGNCGVSVEANAWPALSGIIVREGSDPAILPENAISTRRYMINEHIVGIRDIDTRALTRKLRVCGHLNGMIISGDDECEAFRLEEHIENIRAFRVRDAVKAVVRRETRRISELGDMLDMPSYSLGVTVPDRSIGKGLSVAVVDFGNCEGILKSLLFRSCEVTVYPAGTALPQSHDAVILSGGPGDPKDCQNDAKPLMEALHGGAGAPLLGIGLGHQLMALAAGLDTYRLPYGHRGGNHPVKDIGTGRTFITAQNHGYAVCADSVRGAVITHTQINDGTVEGLSYEGIPAVSVQFHPEAGAGPQECAYIFDNFLKLAKGERA